MTKRIAIRLVLPVLVWGMAIGTWSSSPTSVLAQSGPGYQGLPLDPRSDPESPEFDAQSYKKLEMLRRQVLIETMPLEENKNSFLRWYGMIFSQMTQPDRLQKLPELRQELVRDLATAKSDAIHKVLLDTIYRGMYALTQESVSAGGKTYRMHPAVRYNALLMIGDLNKTEKGIQQPLPVPYRPALTIFVNVLRDPKQSQAMKMAALLGVLRHAKLDWAAPDADRLTTPQRDGLTVMMMNIAKGSGDPDASESGGEVWMRRRALETLAALGAVGRIDEVNQLLDGILADANAAPSLRGTAASLLRFAPDQAKIDPTATAKSLGQLATLICKNELAWIEATKEKALAKKSVGGAGGYPGMGPSYGGEGYDPYGMGMPGGAPGMGMGGAEGSDSADYYGMGMEGYAGGEGYPGMGGYGSNTGKPAVPEDPLLNLARRRLKYQLVRVSQGLDAMQRVSQGGPAATQVEKVVERYQAVMAATDISEGDDPTLDVLAENVRAAMGELALLVQPADSTPDDVLIDDPIGPGPAGAGASPVGPAATPAGPGASPVGPAAAPVGPGTSPVGPAAAAPISPAAGPDVSPVGS